MNKTLTIRKLYHAHRHVDRTQVRSLADAPKPGLQHHGKWPKIKDTFPFCSQLNVEYSQNTCQCIANRGDPNQTASSEAV